MVGGVQNNKMIHGDRNLNQKEYFDNGMVNHGILGVHDIKNNVIYDFNLGLDPKMSKQQIDKYSRSFPNNKIEPVLRKVDR